MDYIVVDFEWNQPRSEKEQILEPFHFDSEIIQIGAVRLNDTFEQQDTFKAFISPTFYEVLNGKVSKLTKIYKGTLRQADSFPEIYQQFIDWCGEEYAFMTWGPNDLPVLMDNLLMHKLPLDTIPVSYDLQRMFGYEVMRENRQYSLENVMKLLRYPMERGHDALNDAINTVKIAQYLDLKNYLQEYPVVYVHYEEDRAGKLPHLSFPNIREALKHPEVISFPCPYCGELLTCEGACVGNNGRSMYTAQCAEGDEFMIRFACHRQLDGSVRMGRMITEMNDDMWDTYQKMLEKHEG